MTQTVVGAITLLVLFLVLSILFKTCTKFTDTIITFMTIGSLATVFLCISYYIGSLILK